MPRTIRIAHVADTHLGYRQYATIDPATGRNQRSIDIEQAYGRVIDDILAREDIDLVVHAGDMFHHTRPSWAAIRTFVEQTRRLSAQSIPFVAIAGNHDMPRLRSSETLFAILQMILPSARIVAGYELEPIPYPGLDLVVHAFPHGALVDPNAQPPVPVPGQRNVLVAHGLVSGMVLPGSHQREPGEAEIGQSLLGGSLDYVALGHFHIHGAQAERTYYAGSPERISWTDFDATPGYNVVTINDMGATVQHVDLPGRPMVRLDRISAATGDARDVADRILAAALAEAQPTGMFRVTLDDADRPKRREIERIIRKESREVAWSLEVLSPRESPFAPREEGADAAAMDITPLTLFEQFVAEKRAAGEYTDQFADAFRDRGVRALQEATLAAEANLASEEAAS
ncbi:MAG TPA: exonuclease SbcCD subunit D [Thermomicrobiales bacterium]|nr:exonuclease SbcCD subunit D [Thermomicrobiales bacterium]